MTDLNFLQNTILTTAEKMEKTILTPAQLSLTDQINLLQLENLNLETEIVKLKTQIADKNIAILKASMLFDEVLDQYDI
jgi:cell division protein FtsL